jgi:TRAP-type C4-dicarboxylate transport system permease large subunit
MIGPAGNQRCGTRACFGAFYGEITPHSLWITIKELHPFLLVKVAVVILVMYVPVLSTWPPSVV